MLSAYYHSIFTYIPVEKLTRLHRENGIIMFQIERIQGYEYTDGEAYRKHYIE